MRVKSAIIKKAVPALNNYGFTFQMPGRSDYLFMKGDGTQSISITMGRFNPKKIKVTYNVYCTSPFSLELGSLNTEFCPASGMTYSTQEELELYIEEVINDSLNIILPFLRIMENNRVFNSYELSRELSIGTTERVKRACSKWNLSQMPSRENLKRLDIIMNGMRTDTACRKDDFYKNKSDIIDLAAYFGELLAISRGMPGQWGWHELSKGSPRFVIQANSYDPLERLIAAWNFGLESFVYSIGRFPLPESRDKGVIHPSD